MAAARVAILEANERDPDGFDEQRDLHRFVRLVLGVADVYDPADVPDGASDDEMIAWLSSLVLKRVGLPRRSFYSAVIRTMRVFVDLPRRRPELLDVDPPNVAFEREVGLTLERYLAICFAVAIRFSGWNREPDSWLLGDGYWANTTVKPDEFRLAVQTLAAPVDTVRKAIERDISAGYNTIDDIWPFITNPLIEIEEHVYLTLDVETLGDALVGDGLYWRMKYNPGATEQERQQLGEAYGHLFEAHCLEVAEPWFSSAPDALFFGEKRYSKVVDGDKQAKDGPDLVVFEGSDAVFIEIGIDRPNMLETVVRGDLESFDKDVQEILLHRAEQLDRKITDFIGGDLSFDGAPAGDVRRIHPVICLIDGFPVDGPLYERIRKRFADAGYLQQSVVEPFEIISAEEFEYLCAQVEAGRKLTAVLRSMAQSRRPLDHEAVRDYLIRTLKASPQPPSHLRREFDEIGDRFAKQLFGKTLQRSKP
jgi:hypothetical protein